MVLQDVAFLPSRASFSPTYLNNFGTGESPRTTICPKAVVGVSVSMLPIKYFCSNEVPSLCQSIFIETA